MMAAMPVVALISRLRAYRWLPQYALARVRGLLIRARYSCDSRVRIGAGLVAEGALHISGPGSVEIGERVLVRRSNCEDVCIRTLSPTARVTIGDQSSLGGVQILCGHQVTLGPRTLAANCRVQDVDFAAPELDQKPGTVRVGAGVWLGLTSLILKGADIGDWAIVAAGSVVERAIEERALAMGNPARPIRGVLG
jgi:carbonic anhydrase/acetyltransferase-like protein (isoleucine patch superfamily)